MGEKLEIFLKVCCIGLLLFQGTMLNLYLSRLHDVSWWSWYVADACVIVIWIGCLIMAAKRIKQDQVDGRRDPTSSPDEIRYAYIAWISYAVVLCPRVVLLFEQEARSLLEKDLLGPNFLKISIACTPLIFLLLVQGSHDARPYTKRKYLIMSVGSTVTLDLFDSIDLLDFCFEQPGGRSEPVEVPHNATFTWVTMKAGKPIPISAFNATLAFACINLFLPTLALAAIRVNSFKGRVPSLPLKIIYECAYVFLVNIPNLLIRSFFWHVYNMDVSILIMKNVMCIAMGLMEIYEYFFGEDKPKKCEYCKHWFQKSYITSHVQECHDGNRENIPLA